MCSSDLKIDNARDTEDQRQADADQKQGGSAGQPVEELDGECVNAHVNASTVRRAKSARRIDLRGEPDQFAGRSFFTTSSDGKYFAPSR